MLDIKEIQNEIDTANSGEPIEWLPLDQAETHKFRKGEFALLPLNHRHRINEETVMQVKLFAVAVRFAGADTWRGLNMRVGMGGSPEEEARELLSQVK